MSTGEAIVAIVFLIVFSSPLWGPFAVLALALIFGFLTQEKTTKKDAEGKDK